MNTIKNLLPAVTATLAHSTPEKRASTAAASSALTGSDWGAFVTDDDPPLVALLQAAQDFAFDLSTPLTRPRWLSLLGSSGAGKTMLARMIYHDARVFCERYPYLECGHRIRRIKFLSWPRMAERLRNGEHTALDEARSAWLTVIDDIGAEYEARSSYIPSKLYDLLNERLGRWTVLTSNLGEVDIANRLDTRIASRMRREGAVIVEVDVPDFNTRSNQ